jgi:putative copper export protein
MMTHSYNFLLHILAFGFSAAALIAFFVLNKKMNTEPDWERKLYIGGIMRMFASFGPYVVIILLLTGIGNMMNRYGLGGVWPRETWLEVKIVLFIILSINALYIAPRINTKRAMLIKSAMDNKRPDNFEQLLSKQSRVIQIFLYVQAALLLSIVVLSALGSGKHPGMF